MSTSKSFFKTSLAEYDTFTTYGTFQEQADLISSLNQNYDDISGNILEYNNKLSEIMTDTDHRYKDFNTQNKANSIWLDKAHRKLNVKDGVKDDLQIMILQQNNSYIIGMITLATVLITTYLVIK